MVGKNIKTFRSEHGLTQEALAERLNVTRQAVSNWENEKTQPDIDTLDRIARELDVTVEELIYGKKKETTVVTKYITTTVKEDGPERGVMIGTVLAMIISYAKWQSIGWAIVHGLLNWVYVVYYLIKHVWS